MNITEVLISYYTNAIEEHKAESKKPPAKKKPATKKIEKTNESTVIMQNNKPVKKATMPKPAIVAPVQESEELLEEPIFGLESTDKSWAKRLKKVNPAAYHNLKNWD
jgi:hypothetical protein